MTLASVLFKPLHRIRRAACALTLSMIALSVATPWPAQAATSTKKHKTFTKTSTKTSTKAAAKSKTGVKPGRKIATKPATKSATKKQKVLTKPAKAKRIKAKKPAHASAAIKPGKKKVTPKKAAPKKATQKQQSPLSARTAAYKRTIASRPAPKLAHNIAPNSAPKSAQPVRVSHVTVANPIPPIKPSIGNIGTTRFITPTSPTTGHDDETPRSAATACRRNGKVFLLADCNAAPSTGSLAANTASKRDQTSPP